MAEKVINSTEQEFGTSTLPEQKASAEQEWGTVVGLGAAALEGQEAGEIQRAA